jgi:hypothetical protein
MDRARQAVGLPGPELLLAGPAQVLQLVASSITANLRGRRRTFVIGGQQVTMEIEDLAVSTGVGLAFGQFESIGKNKATFHAVPPARVRPPPATLLPLVPAPEVGPHAPTLPAWCMPGQGVPEAAPRPRRASPVGRRQATGPRRRAGPGRGAGDG